MNQVIYVQGYDLEDLQKIVNEKIENGYAPYGPVVPFEFGNSGTCGHERGFAQTLIKANHDMVAEVVFR